MVEIDRTRIVSAYSSTVESGKVGDVTVICRIELSAGLTLRMVGGVGIEGGNCREAAESADCTSWAAASMLRSRRNCSVISVEPNTMVELIVSTPGINLN